LDRQYPVTTAQAPTQTKFVKSGNEKAHFLTMPIKELRIASQKRGLHPTDITLVKNGDSVVTKDKNGNVLFTTVKDGNGGFLFTTRISSWSEIILEGHQRSPREIHSLVKKQGEGAAAMAVPLFFKVCLHSSAAHRFSF